MSHQNSTTWQALLNHKDVIKSSTLRQLFADDAQRVEQFTVRSCGMVLDYSKNKITQETQSLLLQLAQEKQLKHAIESMFKGQMINTTEQRSVGHVHLREPQAKAKHPEVHQVLAKMYQFVEAVISGTHLGYTRKQITDVVSIGIGGSFLGPKIVSEALKPYQKTGLKGHFVANIDGTAIYDKLQKLNPETTLFIIASKSFTTQETLTNAQTARKWFLEQATEEAIAQHFVAISSQVDKAQQFGIDADHIFPMWDWVGGRYSLWSAIGLPIALLIGTENFQQLLAGAHSMDEHFYSAPFEQNIPVLLGLIGIWNSNFLNAASHVLLPYDHDLRALPGYIQQLDMESNGKSVQHDGTPVSCDTGPIIWGSEGTNGQHAFHQLLHQGTRFVSVDFILPRKSHRPCQAHHEILASHCFAQSQALMQGLTYDEALQALSGSTQATVEQKQLAKHKMMPGDKPSNTLLIDQVTPATLGALIAAYEHKTYVQGVIWGINSFDQWGVELGKQLGHHILQQIRGEIPSDTQQDSSTTELIKLFKEK
tara:strand:+ start:1984 stop:3597 length:1614 start_codon:yes stop_codon:yes gene_type:complete